MRCLFENQADSVSFLVESRSELGEGLSIGHSSAAHSVLALIVGLHMNGRFVLKATSTSVLIMDIVRTGGLCHGIPTFIASLTFMRKGCVVGHPANIYTFNTLHAEGRRSGSQIRW